MMSIIIRGPLGIGKSTVAKVVAEKVGGIYISVDDVLAQHGLDKAVEGEGIPMENFLEANRYILADAQAAKAQNRSVVVDGNFYHKDQIENLVQLLGEPIACFTLKASVETCIVRDATREKSYGEDAARAVHMFVSAFDYGTVVDTDSQTLQETILAIEHRLPKEAVDTKEGDRVVPNK